MIDIPKDGKIVILTGAGISKESGLDTFRGNGGLWQGFRVEKVAIPHAFSESPAMVHSFYNERKGLLLEDKIKPNAAHHSLALLEQNWGGDVTIVTQNVDNLHERVGSKNLIHMHGELLKARCVICEVIEDWPDEMHIDSVCKKCGQVGTMRVHVVWFGEMPLKMKEIEHRLRECDAFISIGTSGNVYPAAGFVDLVSHYGVAKTVELNLEPSLNADQFSKGLYGPATEIVPQFIEGLLKV